MARTTASASSPQEYSPYEAGLDWSARTKADELVEEVVQFGLEYGARARPDHVLFVDAFRGGHIPGVGPSSARS